MKRRKFHERSIKRHYGGELAGLAHSQLFSQRGFRGIKLGPANCGRRLDAAERQAIEQKMRDEGRLWEAILFSLGTWSRMMRAVLSQKRLERLTVGVPLLI